MSTNISEIRTIVPASQPAWIHWIERVEDEDGSKWWGDAVYPVLAYGVLPGGVGCYLVADPFDSEGPAWLEGSPEPLNPRHEFDIQHCYLNEPTRGKCFSGFTKGYRYAGDAELVWGWMTVSHEEQGK